jgi:putative aldouronate transport system permease protein
MVRQRWLYILLVPSVVAVFLFNYLPLYGVTLAFRNFNAALGPFASPWTEPLLSNFWFFRDPEFWYVLRNTVRISVVKFVFGWPAPIVLALLLNEVRHNGFKRTVQTVSYLPHFLSWVIMAAVTYRILDYEPTSPVNVIRGIFGLDPVALMGDGGAFIPIVVVTAIFKEVGWGTIIYLASIAGINPELYEQAEIDGAGRIRQAWHVTLPGMVPIVSILLVLSIPGILQAGFDQLYNLMNASTRRVAYVTDIYVLRLGLIQGQYATATAIGLVYSAVGLTLTLIANKVSKSSYGHGIF